MKLIYDYQIFSLQKHGGISRYFYEIISRLSNNELDSIYAFLGLNINEYGLENFRGKFSGFFGCKHAAIPKTGRLFGLVNNLVFSQYISRNAYDVYHPTYYSYLGSNYSGRRVITVYDMIHEKYPRFFPSLDNTSRLKKAAVEKADGIICISESTKRDLIEIFAVPAQKIKVIYLSNSLIIDPVSIPIVSDPYILYVGQRNGYKNFDLLLRAFAQSPQIKNNFKIACFGGGNITASEASLLKDLKIDNRIIMLSGSDDKLANLYKYASVFVYPSLYEGFGIPPLEAMHYGCPVLVAKTSSIPEVVGDAGWYFEPGNTEDLAVNLDKMLRDEAILSRLTNRGYQREKHFSWDRCAAETREYYRCIAEGL